jgi:hypothetical protein
MLYKGHAMFLSDVYQARWGGCNRASTRDTAFVDSEIAGASPTARDGDITPHCTAHKRRIRGESGLPVPGSASYGRGRLALVVLGKIEYKSTHQVLPVDGGREQAAQGRIRTVGADFRRVGKRVAGYMGAGRASRPAALRRGVRYMTGSREAPADLPTGRSHATGPVAPNTVSDCAGPETRRLIAPTPRRRETLPRLPC